MKILYLPSWWPNKIHKFSGIFFKEQIERLAELHPQHQFHIFYWGHPELEIKPGKFIQTIKNLLSFSKLASSVKKLPNLIFIQVPIPTLPRRFGGIHLQIFFIKLVLKLKNINFDLIHALVGYPSGIIAKELSKDLKIPYLITEVMGPFPFPQLRNKDGSIWQPLLSAYQNSNLNIADGKLKLVSMQNEGIHHLKYIPNFINEEQFFIKKNSDKEIVRKFHFFTLGGFVPGKGIDILLRAIALLENNEHFHFVIGGGGPLKKTLIKLTQELKISHLIEWHDHLDREQAIAQYHRCDAFVLPSKHESFGIVYVESLFCGKPVIATRCGGPEEFINEDNGILCTVDDEVQLANALNHLKNNIINYDSEKIRNWAVKKYGSKYICAEILSCYKDLLNANSMK